MVKITKVREETQMATEKNRKKSKQTKRRIRINRMKSFIVFFAVILLFTSVILNFILMVKVMHLEGQIEQLYSTTMFIKNIMC